MRVCADSIEEAFGILVKLIDCSYDIRKAKIECIIIMVYYFIPFIDRRGDNVLVFRDVGC